jgi:hypothetical protein
MSKHADPSDKAKVSVVHHETAIVIHVTDSTDSTDSIEERWWKELSANANCPDYKADIERARLSGMKFTDFTRYDGIRDDISWKRAVSASDMAWYQTMKSQFKLDPPAKQSRITAFDSVMDRAWKEYRDKKALKLAALAAREQLSGSAGSPALAAPPATAANSFS